ncbi:MAG: hypothetical protein J5917_06755 [Bacteroidales bacterium]|nr:hypothetical protein [Bacteroidales bacterium]
MSKKELYLVPATEVFSFAAEQNILASSVKGGIEDMDLGIGAWKTSSSLEELLGIPPIL